MIRQLLRDVVEMTRAAQGTVDARAIAKTLPYDSLWVVAMLRLRETARRWHIPGLNRTLRLLQMTVYNIEIGNEVTMGRGVYLVHTVGTVIGGNAKIGNRVKFMGNNTVGTAKDNGYPVIEDDVVVGCGARVLGPIRIGAGSVIGANSVVLRDMPPGSLAVGVPAEILADRKKNRPGTDPRSPSTPEPTRPCSLVDKYPEDSP